MAHKKVYLIRHGKTKGNLEKRYIGRKKDEHLCETGINETRKLRREIPDSFFKEVDRVCVGPMIRARETAEILFEGCSIEIADKLTETDFGYFEGKNHSELDGDEIYQKWIDSNGSSEIPDGEKREDFIERSYKGFIDALGDFSADECIAIVCHGGNIMGILSLITGENYFDFMTDNLGCWLLDLETDDKGIISITYNRFDLRKPS